MTPPRPARTRQVVAAFTIITVLVGGLFAVWAVTTNMIQTLQNANLTPEGEPATAPPSLALLYAVKAPGQQEVVLYRDDTAGGAATPVFRYTEPLAWDGLSTNTSGKDPDCALSPDGGRLAYVDEAGLKVADLATGAVTSLVVKTGIRQRGNAGNFDLPEWSSPELNTVRVYLLVRPVWSPDGTRIAVTAALYQGSRLATVNLATRDLLLTTWRGLRYAWLSDSVGAIAIGTTQSEVEDRLVVGNLTTGGLTQTIGGSPGIGNIKWPAVAPDGRSLAFVGEHGISSTSPVGGQTLYLWQGAGQPRPVADLNPRFFGAASDDNWPFFDSAGSALYWFDQTTSGDVVLNSAALAPNTRTSPLSLGPGIAARFLQWDPDGSALIAIYDATGEAQVLAAAPDTGSLQALGPPLPAFSRVLGVAR